MVDEYEDEQDGDEDAHTHHASGSGPVTPSELLRQALVDDQDPRFPRWLPIPGLIVGVAWAAYQTFAGDAGLFATIGTTAAVAVGTTLVAWFGWQLEID